MTTLSPIASETDPVPPALPPSRRGDIAGVLLAGYAFLLCVAWSNRVFNWFILPKAAVGLCVIGPGLVALMWLLKRRDLPAVAATAFLTLAALATVLADEPVMSFFGEYFSLNGFVFVAACVATWALGRTARGRTGYIEGALVAGATVNAMVAWLQVSTDLGVEGLGLFEGRAQGLMGNPVFLAALCAGGLWLVLARERQAARPLMWLALAGFLAGAIELSGSRISLAVAFVVVIWFVVAHLRRAAWSRAAFVVLAIAAGFAIAQVPGTPQASGAERVGADASNGLGPRVQLWRAAIDAVGDRPLLGYGPGRTQAATSPRRSLSLARYEGPDVLFADAHNFIVEVLTTTGILGFAAFLAWLVLAGRRARGPLAGFAVVGAVAMLLEPLNVGLTPLVLLALGAAAADAAEPALTGSSWFRSRLAVGISLVTLVAGVAFGVVLISGDTHYRSALRDGSFGELSAADRRFPPWPQVPGVRASLLAATARNGGRPVERRAIAAERDALARDEADPYWWYQLGAFEEQWGTPARASQAYREALRRNPWSQNARLGLFRLALRADDRDRAARLRGKMCEVGPAYCPPRSALNQRPDRDPVPPRTPRPPAPGT